MFYFYVRQLATKSGVQPVQLLHLLVPLVFAVTQYILYSGLSQADRVTYLLTNIDHHPSHGGRFYGLYLNSLLGRYIFATQVAVYIILSLRLIKNHEEQVEQMFSNEDRYGLGWVKLLTLFMIIMSVTVFILAIAGREPFARHDNLLMIPSVIVSILLFSFGYIGHVQLRRTELISPIIEIEEKSNRFFSGEEGLRNKFDDYFAKQKPFLDKDLKIWDISRELGSNRTYISRIINDEYGMNFTKFVNQFRIEEAKRLIREDINGQLTYGIIAELSGFGSINSLNQGI